LTAGAHPLLSAPGDKKARLIAPMVTLTLLTGAVDAVSYLRLGHVFVANMTGNVVFLGFALAGASGLSATSSLIALGAFIVGALLRATATLQTSLIALALVVALAVGEPLGQGGRYAITVPLALAMGLQNAAAQELAVPELTTTVLTKTLTALATAPGAARQLTARRLLAILSMLLGALAGGLLVIHASVPWGLGLALALAAIAAAHAHVLRSRDPASSPAT